VLTEARSLALSEWLANLSELQTPIASLDQWLLNQDDCPDPALLTEQVRTLTGEKPLELVQIPTYRADSQRVVSSLTALMLAPQGMERVRAELLGAMYIFGLLERLAWHADELQTAADIFNLLVYGIVILPLDFPATAEALALPRQLRISRSCGRN
jgi:hypothetical protein